MNILRCYFVEDDAQEISQIPLSIFGGQDSLYWSFAETGQYTVKAGYARAKEVEGLRQKK